MPTSACSVPEILPFAVEISLDEKSQVPVEHRLGTTSLVPHQYLRSMGYGLSPLAFLQQQPFCLMRNLLQLQARPLDLQEGSDRSQSLHRKSSDIGLSYPSHLTNHFVLHCANQPRIGNSSFIIFRNETGRKLFANFLDEAV